MPAPLLPPLVDGPPDGILVADLPTPFGTVRSYLLPDSPVTLVDPGTVTPESLAALEGLLAAGGRTVGDVEQVVVTHAHPDHWGAAAWVARRSGARILTGRAEAPRLTGDDRSAGRRAALLERAGAPTELARLVAAPDLGGVVEPASGPDVVPVDDGGVLQAGGRTFVALVTPGHSPGHLSLWDAPTSTLLSGDHLLSRIIPATGLEPAIEGDGHRHSLQEYLGSLDRFTELDPAVVLPGHGAPFTGTDVLARRLRAHHAERAARVRDLVAELGRPSAFEVATQLLWQAEGHRMVRGVGEVVAHLDLLVGDGSVVTEDDGRVHRYRVSGRR